MKDTLTSETALKTTKEEYTIKEQEIKEIRENPLKDLVNQIQKIYSNYKGAFSNSLEHLFSINQSLLTSDPNKYEKEYIAFLKAIGTIANSNYSYIKTLFSSSSKAENLFCGTLKKLCNLDKKNAEEIITEIIKELNLSSTPQLPKIKK